ncbi:hypothetical protein [Sporisorium scitamineum]|uniref:Uncharacterized protein n=1 Tax=Sporisorium scitamineum TaxID=49012 RepID=A0A0F7S2T0_9BASI|nr:hypothetical protein [Sporisorium scitamineum]
MCLVRDLHRVIRWHYENIPQRSHSETNVTNMVPHRRRLVAISQVLLAADAAATLLA